MSTRLRHSPIGLRGSGDDGGETRQERINRELMELLNELRVAIPGVQFLFAFLLVVPFQPTAGDMSDFQLGVYFVALVAAAVATALLIAPAAQHRVLFRKQDKEALLRRSSASALAGTVVLAVAVVSALLLVLDVLFPPVLVWVTAGTVGALLAWWWLAVPYWHRAHDDDRTAGS